MRARKLLLVIVSLSSPLGCSARPGDVGTATDADSGDGVGDPSTATTTMNQITLEDIATYPLPGMSFPQRIKFTRDGDSITFLDSKDGSLRRELFSLNLKTGERALVLNAGDAGITEENLSLEEKLRRERARERGLGITTYQWSREGDTLLVPLAGALQVQHGLQGSLKTVVEKSASPPLASRLSRDGAYVAYVQDDELYVADVDTGTSTQVTSGARGTGKTNGLAEYIAQEEMGRSTGFWWSRDARHLAFVEVDETHIPEYRIMHQGKDAVGDGAQENHRYPFAGAQNARVRLGVVGRDGGDVRWMNLGEEQDIYLARVQWMPDGSLWVQRQNRAQTRLDLLRFDPATGASDLVLSETTEVWINLHNMLRAIEEGPLAGHFLWASERDGFRHLYLYDADGKLVRPLTSGEWMVDRLVAVDEEGQRVFFEATKDDPRERHLYVVKLDGTGLTRITQAPGMHGTTINKTFTAFIDTHHSMTSPPAINVRSLADGAVWLALRRRADAPKALASGRYVHAARWFCYVDALPAMVAAAQDYLGAAKDAGNMEIPLPGAERGAV
ncbi:MAG: DPP IV N-terminal domain-containing protein, partial [Nannocystaceae bacterium]